MILSHNLRKIRINCGKYFPFFSGISLILKQLDSIYVYLYMYDARIESSTFQFEPRFGPCTIAQLCTASPHTHVALNLVFAVSVWMVFFQQSFSVFPNRLQQNTVFGSQSATAQNENVLLSCLSRGLLSTSTFIWDICTFFSFSLQCKTILHCFNFIKQ